MPPSGFRPCSPVSAGCAAAAFYRAVVERGVKSWSSPGPRVRAAASSAGLTKLAQVNTVAVTSSRHPHAAEMLRGTGYDEVMVLDRPTDPNEAIANYCPARRGPTAYVDLRHRPTGTATVSSVPTAALVVDFDGEGLVGEQRAVIDLAGLVISGDGRAERWFDLALHAFQDGVHGPVTPSSVPTDWMPPVRCIASIARHRRRRLARHTPAVGHTFV
ncbi:MAG: hypothetical protein R2705_13405 [Ilumatobacteraceae bacterium]